MSMEEKDRLWDIAWEHPDDEVADAAFEAWKAHFFAPSSLSLKGTMDHIQGLHRLQHLGYEYQAGFRSYEDASDLLAPSPPRKPALPDASITQMKMELG